MPLADYPPLNDEELDLLRQNSEAIINAADVGIEGIELDRIQALMAMRMLTTIEVLRGGQANLVPELKLPSNWQVNPVSTDEGMFVHVHVAVPLVAASLGVLLTPTEASKIGRWMTSIGREAQIRSDATSRLVGADGHQLSRTSPNRQPPKEDNPSDNAATE